MQASVSGSLGALCARLAAGVLSASASAAAASCSSAGTSTSYALQTTPLMVRWLSTHTPATVRASPSASVVPAQLLQEHEALEAMLRRRSQIDGRKRLDLSSPQLPFAVQPHTIEDDLPSIDVHVRPGTGGVVAKWLRRAGRLPARIYSLPGEKELNIHLLEKDALKMVRTYGRNGCQARAFRLNVVHPEQPDTVLASIRVKPTAVRAHAASARLQDLDFLFCPVEREVVVDVPLRLVNDDAAPGVKRGGWMNVLRRTVRFKALGGALPPFLELSVKHLELEQGVTAAELPVPQGARLYEKNPSVMVVRCTQDVGKD